MGVSPLSTSAECGITNIQDEEDFTKRVLRNTQPVIIDFHATWCGPCKILGPRLENAMKPFMKSVLLAKVDVDNVESVALKYNVSAVPTVIYMKDGKELDRFQGAKEAEFIVKKIKTVLGVEPA